MKRFRRAVVPLLAAAAAGCGGARGGASPEPDSRVAIEVLNLSGSRITVQLCANVCLPPRQINALRQTVFVFQPQHSRRARISARTPQRLLPDQTVDFEPGDRKEVSFNVF